MGGLFNSATLDVIVGLIFVYLLLAIMCSSINELIAGVFHSRSATLANGIRQLLDQQAGKNPGDPGANTQNTALDWLVQRFHAHPLITSMKPGGNADGRLPSYIPSRTFATVLMDIVTPQDKGPINFGDLEQGINALPNGDVKRTLLALIQNAQDDLEKAQKNIENWYDDTMGQVSGWYKRKAALATFLIAVALTLGADADTIQTTRNLWTNPTARAQMVEQSKKTTNTDGKVPQASKDDLDSMSTILPGWRDLPTGDRSQLLWGWLRKLLGWILTVAAVSLGAPFWFDILGKLANLRNAGQKPGTATADTAT